MDELYPLTQISKASELSQRLLLLQQYPEAKQNTNDLPSITLTLCNVLVHIQNLFEGNAIAQSRLDAIVSITNIVDDLIHLLESHLLVLDGVYRGTTAGGPCSRFIHTRVQQKRTKECFKLYKNIESIASELLHQGDVLEMSGIVLQPGLPFPATSQEPKHHHMCRAPNDGDSAQPSSLVSHGVHADDEDSQLRHAHFDNDPLVSTMPELEGSYTHAAELTSSNSPRSASDLSRLYWRRPTLEQLNHPFDNPGNLLDLNLHDEPSRETYSEPEHDKPSTFDSLPASTIPSTPPPPYSPLDHNVGHEAYLQEPDCIFDRHIGASSNSAVPHDDDDAHVSWVNPITLACRLIMRERFPSTTPALFDDYAIYRQHIRSQPNYKWYLNFRYMSLVLQAELPLQVFLVDFSVHRGNASTGVSLDYKLKALAYVFKDCIVFARSSLSQVLPDPNTESCSTAYSPDEPVFVLDSGLEILESCSIRFCNIVSVTPQDKKAILIEYQASMDGGQLSQDSHGKTKQSGRFVTTEVHRIEFTTICQCRRVLYALRLWLEKQAKQDYKEPAEHINTKQHHCHHHVNGPSHGNCKQRHYCHCLPPVIASCRQFAHTMHISCHKQNHNATPRSFCGNLKTKQSCSQHDFNHFYFHHEYLDSSGCT